MVRYYILISACACLMACETTESLKKEEPLYKHPYASNPGLTPLEKPSLEDEFYEAPKIP